MKPPITTRDICVRFGIPESTLRHILRRPGAPRPQMHPSARLFLWELDDVEALARFLERGDASGRAARSATVAEASHSS
jgi:hypothetical protein